jgi:hypothetical protein
MSFGPGMQNSEGLGGASDLQFNLAERLAIKVAAQAKDNSSRQALTRFGPALLRIQTCGVALATRALDPLRHAMTESTERVDLHLIMIDAKETGVDATIFDNLALANTLTRSDRRDALGSAPLVDPNWTTRCFISKEKRRAIVWFTDAAAAPEWVIYDQIRNALHWTSFEHDFGLFHAAALQFEDVGCLIAGKSGSGKSTLTAAAIAHGFHSAGDDFVLVDLASAPRAHPIFDTVKLREDSLAQFLKYRALVRNPERQREEKATLHLSDVAPDNPVSEFALHAILHARLARESQSRIVKSSAAAAYLSLAPSSLLLLRTQSKRVSAKCAKLISRLPTYEFQIGTDVNAAAVELASFMRALMRLPFSNPDTQRQ